MFSRYTIQGIDTTALKYKRVIKLSASNYVIIQPSHTNIINYTVQSNCAVSKT